MDTDAIKFCNPKQRIKKPNKTTDSFPKVRKHSRYLSRYPLQQLCVWMCILFFLLQSTEWSPAAQLPIPFLSYGYQLPHAASHPAVLPFNPRLQQC